MIFHDFPASIGFPMAIFHYQRVEKGDTWKPWGRDRPRQLWGSDGGTLDVRMVDGILGAQKATTLGLRLWRSFHVQWAAVGPIIFSASNESSWRTLIHVIEIIFQPWCSCFRFRSTTRSWPLWATIHGKRTIDRDDSGGQETTRFRRGEFWSTCQVFHVAPSTIQPTDRHL